MNRAIILGIIFLLCVSAPSIQSSSAQRGQPFHNPQRMVVIHCPDCQSFTYNGISATVEYTLSVCTKGACYFHLGFSNDTIKLYLRPGALNVTWYLSSDIRTNHSMMSITITLLDRTQTFRQDNYSASNGTNYWFWNQGHYP